MRRTVGAIIAVAIVAAGCGGDSGTGAVSDSDPGLLVALSDVEFEEEDLQLADAAIDALGDEAAGAVLLALERGYSTGQVRDGIDGGGLGADGSIEGEEPVASRLGRFTIPVDESALGQAVLVAFDRAQGSEVDVEDVIDEYAEIGPRRLIALILALARSGYSEEQIVDAVFTATGPKAFGFADIISDDGEAVRCLYYTDSDTLPVRPTATGDDAARRSSCASAITDKSSAENDELDGIDEDYRRCELAAESQEDAEECFLDAEAKRCEFRGGTPEECRPPEAGGLDSLTDSVIFFGTAAYTDTDSGGFLTCEGLDWPIRVSVGANRMVEVIYIRTEIAQLGDLGPGPTEDYLECGPANRRGRHEGSLTESGVEITGLDNEGDGASIEVTIRGGAASQVLGTIAASDLFNSWTLQFNLTDACESDCNRLPGE